MFEIQGTIHYRPATWPMLLQYPIGRSIQWSNAINAINASHINISIFFQELQLHFHLFDPLFRGLKSIPGNQLARGMATGSVCKHFTSLGPRNPVHQTEIGCTWRLCPSEAFVVSSSAHCQLPRNKIPTIPQVLAGQNKTAV